MRSSAKRKRAGRPRAPRRRPVLAARVPEEFLARIQASARAHGRNVSEELMWLAEQCFVWQEQFASHQEMQKWSEKVTAGNLQPMMRLTGYTRFEGVNGAAWFEPGVDAARWIFANTSAENRAVQQDMLDQAIMRAVEKMKTQP